MKFGQSFTTQFLPVQLAELVSEHLRIHRKVLSCICAISPARWKHQGTLHDCVFVLFWHRQVHDISRKASLSLMRVLEQIHTPNYRLRSYQTVECFQNWCTHSVCSDKSTSGRMRYPELCWNRRMLHMNLYFVAIFEHILSKEDESELFPIVERASWIVTLLHSFGA